MPFLSELLAASKKDMSLLLELSPEALFVFKKDGELVFMNKAAKALEGTLASRQKEEENQKNLIFFDERDKKISKRQRPFEKLRRGETFDKLEYRVEDPDTGESWYRSMRGIVLDDDPHLYLFVRDFTKQAQAEQRFELAVRVNPVPTLVIRKRDLHIVDASESLFNFVELSDDDICDKPLKDIKLLDKLKAELSELKEEDALEDTELILSINTKREAYVIVKADPILIKKEAYLYVTLLDITLRKHAELKMREAIRNTLGSASSLSKSIIEQLTLLESPISSKKVNLTKREEQIIRLVARGWSNSKITSELTVAPTTLRNHIANIYKKLGVHTRVEAVVWARQQGFTGP